MQTTIWVKELLLNRDREENPLEQCFPVFLKDIDMR